VGLVQEVVARERGDNDYPEGAWGKSDGPAAVEKSPCCFLEEIGGRVAGA